MEETYAAIGMVNGEQHTELCTEITLNRLLEWLHGYTRWGDYGGYDAIAVVDPDDQTINVYNADGTMD